MTQAVYEKLGNGTISGRIPIQVFREVEAEGETEEACRQALRGLLEEWVVIRLRERSLLPVLDGLDLNKVARPKLSREELAGRYKNPVQWTEHPWVVRVEGYCGGRPIILGSRIPVRVIVVAWVRQAMPIWEVLENWDLHEAQIYDALSYYYDHKEEIDREIRLNEDMEYWMKKYPPGKYQIHDR